MILSVSPVFILIFLFITSPCTVYLDPYTQIMFGSFFITCSSIPMLFGINYFDIFMFIIVVSFGESLISPKLYEFIFYFTKKGKEGLFLSITSAPHYLTMAASGITGGILLQKFFPDEAS